VTFPIAVPALADLHDGVKLANALVVAALVGEGYCFDYLDLNLLLKHLLLHRFHLRNYLLKLGSRRHTFIDLASEEDIFFCELLELFLE